MGACAVHEYQLTACQLLWGPDPSAKQASIGFRPPTNTILTKLAQVSLNAPPPLGPTGAPVLPEVERIRSGQDFWNEVVGAVQDRARIDADFYSRSLAFLAQQSEVSERPQIAVGALLFVMAAGVLRYLADLPGEADVILTSLIANRQRLVAFAREGSPAGGAVQGQIQFMHEVKLPEGITTKTAIPGTLSGLVTLGCAEFSFQPIAVAEMVKSPWTSEKMPRCGP